MQRIKISEKVDFSRIIQGFWRVTDWNISTDELVKYINSCLERGVDTFDTAAIYGTGECEVQVGKALKQLPRDSYKIISKCGIIPGVEYADGFYNTSYDEIIESCKTTIRKLNCEYLDLFLIHREDPLINHAEAARALKQLKKEGLILEAGVSNFDPFKYNALDYFMDGTLKMNQIEWNPCCFEHFESGMMDLLQQKSVHPMIWSPLCGGRLLTDNDPFYASTRKVIAEVAEKHGVSISTVVYAWILMHPVQAMPLVGSGKIARLDDAIKAFDVSLSLEDWYKIYRASGQKILR